MTDSPVEWRAVPSLDGWYDVTADGQVRSWRKPGGGGRGDMRAAEPHAMTLYTRANSPHPFICIELKGRSTTRVVRRLVAEVFPEGATEPALEVATQDPQPAKRGLWAWLTGFGKRTPLSADAHAGPA